MDKIKKISYEEIKEIAVESGFDLDMLLKDYYLTVILFIIQDVEGIYFKGGTALQKIFLNYARLSEDLDFTITRPLEEIKKEITARLKGSGLFHSITKDKDVEGFTRLIAHYKDFSNQDSEVFIDLNQKASLLLKPETHQIRHFYKELLPDFSFSTLARDEMVAEKISAAIKRNKPRDHYDIYRIFELKIPIRFDLAKKKCEQGGIEFNIIKIFNQAQKLKNRWDTDMIPLLPKKISFQEMIKKLAVNLKLKEEKEKLRDRKKH